LQLFVNVFAPGDHPPAWEGAGATGILSSPMSPTESPTRPDALVRPHPSRLAPDHPRYREILQAHASAVAGARALYRDPVSGFWVMTAATLIERGACCTKGCRHCPFVGATG
jgi:hypothetical protein